MSETSHLDGKVILCPHDDGSFDELIVKEGEECRVHMEMMDDNCLWIAIYPKGEPERRMTVWVRARGKLKIAAYDDQ